MNLAEYDYNLPVELIAQKPPEVRDQSRLMVLPEGNHPVLHTTFTNLPEFLRKGDLLVVNDTRVFPARLVGTKENTGAEIEIFLLRPYGDGTWDALSRPAKRLKEGTVIDFGNGALRAVIVEKGADGRVRTELSSDMDIDEALEKLGKTPLPPYIKREPEDFDRERYQTVYAKERGAVAAPTAGLHFSGILLDKLASMGVERAAVTLHVGIGTFKPLTEDEARSDRLHSEYCIVTETTVDKIRSCRSGKGRVVVVGTTTARALETASSSGAPESYEGWTDLFIKPPYRFRSVDALITNFHLPRSSLLVLVSAFTGRNRILNAYREAVSKQYRFYSYGDAMLIFGGKA
ncbi:tRNA preQ1(34) S-adenosylmethionine ribosyltransferase-isomerase QueA [bacterium]|nr:tRNA preQ1(34) S-adenosylmethionine ribosyltransferase-isomerase QueA [bacterium]